MVEKACRTLKINPQMMVVSPLMMRIAGFFIPEARASVEMMYEFTDPFVVDSNRIQRAFVLMRWEGVAMTSRHYTDSATPDSSKRYASDLTDQEFISEQLELLQIYRLTLSHYLKQWARHSGAYVPPSIGQYKEAPVNDIRVTNWMELLHVLSNMPQNKFDRYRSDFVYRGLANESWDLKTSLKRLGKHAPTVEQPLLRSFHKYAEPGSILIDNLWFQLAVAQHHGLPTRLMDWTASPKVAIHFATAEEEHYDKDGVIWCIDVVKARELLPERLRAILGREHAFLFSVKMLEIIPTLNEFDNLAADGNFVLFLEPPSLDTRIVNQWAIMSVMPSADRILSDFLKSHPELYHRIIISKECKWEVRDKLDQDNVTERMLFPGLDGLSRWLKRYYGPGPNPT